MHSTNFSNAVKFALQNIDSQLRSYLKGLSPIGLKKTLLKWKLWRIQVFNFDTKIPRGKQLIESKRQEGIL